MEEAAEHCEGTKEALERSDRVINARIRGKGKELTSSLFEMPSEYCPDGGKRTEAQAPALRGALHSKTLDVGNY